MKYCLKTENGCLKTQTKHPLVSTKVYSSNLLFCFVLFFFKIIWNKISLFFPLKEEIFFKQLTKDHILVHILIDCKKVVHLILLTNKYFIIAYIKMIG